jgi:hypothetical protein
MFRGYQLVVVFELLCMSCCLDSAPSQRIVLTCIGITRRKPLEIEPGWMQERLGIEITQHIW